MNFDLELSRRAWSEALRGMKVEKPTYKVCLLLEILREVDSGQAAPDRIPAGPEIERGFDHFLLRHGALDRPGRWIMPRQYLATGRGDLPDQLWVDRGDHLEVLPPYIPVLADPAGRSWLRGAIFDWLRPRTDPVSIRLANLLRLGLGEAERDDEVQRLTSLWNWARDRSGVLSPADTADRFLETQIEGLAGGLSTLGMAGLLREEGDDLWTPEEEASWSTGLEILQAFSQGRTDMTFLDTRAKRRQGQRAWSLRVRGNYGNRCAVCHIDRPWCLEGAHLVPVAVDPSIGLAVDNGVSLCRNHHAAMDRGFLALRGDQILQEFETGRDDGLLSTLRAKPVQPIVPLLAAGLEYLERQYRQ